MCMTMLLGTQLMLESFLVCVLLSLAISERYDLTLVINSHLLTRYNIPGENFHLAGHSLGSHLMVAYFEIS